MSIGNENVKGAKIYDPVLLWDMQLPSWVYSVTMSSDGNYLAAGSRASSGQWSEFFWQKGSGTPVWHWSSSQYTYEVDMDSSGQYVASAGTGTNGYNLIDRNGNWQNGYSPSMGTIAISGDGNYIVSGSYNSPYTIYLFNKNSGNPQWTYTTGNPISSVDISNNGQYLVAGTNSGQYKIYLFSKDSSTPQWTYTTSSYVHDVSISADGNYIIAHAGNTAYFFQRSSSSPQWTKTTFGSAGGTAISSDGSYIAIAAGNLYLYNTAGTQLWVSTGSNCYEVDMTSNGNNIVTGSGVGYPSIKFYQKNSNVPLWQYSVNRQVNSVKVSSNGLNVFFGVQGDNYFGKVYLLNWVPATITFYTSPTTGTITFNGIQYNNGDSTQTVGAYPITANPPTTYQFYQWTTTGGVTVANPTQSSTTATVNSDGSLTALFSRPPNQPTDPPGGASSGFINVEYEYTISTTDPDGDQIYYLFDWGDGSDSDWIGPLNSGEEGSATHTWTAQGTYTVKAKAKDIHNLIGSWSPSLSVVIVDPYYHPPGPPTDLLCDGLVNPQTISNPKPKFSAIYNDPYPQDIATMVEIQVGTDTDWNVAEMWVGTLTCSASAGQRCADIEYDGNDLQPYTTYYWRLKFKDGYNWGEWSTTANFKTYLIDKILPLPSQENYYNFPPVIIDLLLDPFPSDENLWFQGYGYGNKVSFIPNNFYARSGLFDGCSFDDFIFKYYSVDTLIGASYTVPIVTQAGTWHSAYIRVEGNYEGTVKAKYTGISKIFPRMIIEDGSVPSWPSSFPIYEKYLDEITEVDFWGQKNPSKVFTFDNNQLSVTLQEGETYGFYLNAHTDIFVCNLYNPLPKGRADPPMAEAFADLKINWNNIKIDWHNPPSPPPITEHPPEDASISYQSMQRRVGIPIEFSISAIDQDNDMIYYILYWDDGTTSEVGPYSSGQTISVAHTYDLPATYFIRVQAKDNSEYSMWSPLSERTEVQVDPPEGTITINSPSGYDQWYGGTTQTITWSWTGSVMEDCMILLFKKIGDSYQFQYDITEGPISIYSGAYSWRVAPELETALYQIRIINFADGGLSDDFQIFQNSPPNTPSITGQQSGKSGRIYSYTFMTNDPEGENVQYYIDWGDGNIVDWTDQSESGQVISIDHEWSQGTFTVSAKAKDIHGAESDWGTLEVTMALDYSSGFVPGSQIYLANGLHQNIENIRVGDVILGYNLAVEQTEPVVVTNVFYFIGDEIESGLVTINRYLEVTANHVIYINGYWNLAGKAQVGDTLLRAPSKSTGTAEPLPITSIVTSEKPRGCYALEVSATQNGDHTYFVNDILVHQ